MDVFTYWASNVLVGATENWAINNCVSFVSQGTLSATVVKSSFQPKPPLTYIHVFGVASNPSSVTVNGSPITSYSYNTTTKVVLSSVSVVIRSNGSSNDCQFNSSYML